MKNNPLCWRKLTVQKGFSLVELLVAVVILAIGVLGTIAMQARALNDNLDAYMRTQANLLAYDLSDRMRANPSGWVNVPVASDNNCNFQSVSCSPIQMAQYDFWNWQNDINEKLTGATGTVVPNGNLCSGVPAAGMRIRITWQRANTDVNNRLGDACYSLDVVLRS